MIRRLENQPQYESFEACVEDLKAQYRRKHRGETEGLHYEFNVTPNPDGRSGFVKAERLEPSPTFPNARDETFLIEDNRVVAHDVHDEGYESNWLE